MLSTQRTTELALAIWNDHDYDALERLYAPNYVLHNPQNPIRGRDAYLAYCKEIHAAFPDMHIDIHHAMSEGDYVVTRWTAGGTHNGEFRGIAPTGKTIVVSGMTMDHFMAMDEFTHYDGKAIVEGWENADDLGIMQQLGVIPTE